MPDNPHGLLLPPELSPRGYAAPGPGHRTARVLSWIAVLTSAAVLLASGVGYALFTYYNGNIGRLPWDIGGKRPDKVAGRSLNFLLVGSDSREGASKAELKQFATEFTPGRRSDTVILIHLSGDREKVTLVSFPRDAWVAIPAYGKRRAHMGKLNTAFSDGGQILTAQTIENLTGIHLDHYIEVNFAGFQRMVDALGGVDVCLRRPARDSLSGINLSAGKHRIKGTQALAYVRQRHGLPRGDLDRIERQQKFIGAMVRRATSLGVLLNPVRLLSFLKTSTDSLQVDESMSFNDMKALGLALKGLDPGRVSFLTAPIERVGMRSGQSVVLLHEAAGRAMYDAVAHDIVPGERAPAPPVTATTKLTVAPNQIRLTVLNGSGIKGRAKLASDDLRGLGFRIAKTGNADVSNYQAPTVLYAYDREEAAKTVAAALPGAVLRLDPSSRGSITLVVGRDYRGVQPVNITPGAIAPKPTTPVTPPPLTAADATCGR